MAGHRVASLMLHELVNHTVAFDADVPSVTLGYCPFCELSTTQFIPLCRSRVESQARVWFYGRYAYVFGSRAWGTYDCEQQLLQ